MQKHELEAIRDMLNEALETKNRERVVNALALVEVCLASWDDGLHGGRREWVPGFGEVIIGPSAEEQAARRRATPPAPAAAPRPPDDPHA